MEAHWCGSSTFQANVQNILGCFFFGQQCTFVEVLSFLEFLFDFYEILHTHSKLVVIHLVQAAKRSDEYFKSYSTSNRGPFFLGQTVVYV